MTWKEERCGWGSIQRWLERGEEERRGRLGKRMCEARRSSASQVRAGTVRVKRGT